MTLSKPSDIEVAQLIKETKSFLNNDNDLKTSLPTIIGKYDKDFSIVSNEDNKIEYILHAYRGKYDKSRYSLHLRFKENIQRCHLVRLDINSGTNHKNYDQTKVGKNHIHILKYVKSLDKSEEYAYSLDNIPFFADNGVVFNCDDEMVESFDNFLKFVNINNK